MHEHEVHTKGGIAVKSQPTSFSPWEKVPEGRMRVLAAEETRSNAKTPTPALSQREREQFSSRRSS